MVLCDDTKKKLIELSKNNQIYLEGNILKLIEPDDNEFGEYIETAKTNDRENRRKRLDITKQIQTQNKELVLSQQKNEELMNELRSALESTENTKKVIENDLDILQKKVQTELIGTIVKASLWIIIGIASITSLMYLISMFMNRDSKIIESSWSNMLGILLTNSFSIIGTIMGVKYASEKK